MNLDKIILELNKKQRSEQSLTTSSPWFKHTYIEREKIIQFSHWFDEGVQLNQSQVKIIKNYLDNEAIFYQEFIKQFTTLLPEILLDYNIEVPNKITPEFITKNIALIGIKIETKDDKHFLEFDFEPSWSAEHGIVALTYNNTILGFAESGYCWGYDTDGEEGPWYIDDEEKTRYFDINGNEIFK